MKGRVLVLLWDKIHSSLYATPHDPVIRVKKNVNFL